MPFTATGGGLNSEQYDELDRFWHRIKAASYEMGGQNFATLFSKLDRDKSGTLTFEELRQAVRRTLRITPKQTSDTTLRGFFTLLDCDGGGRVELQEMVEFMEDGPDALVKVLKARNLAKARGEELQPDAMDTLWKALVANAHTTGGKDWLVLFNRLDTDDSGYLHYEELYDAIRQKLHVSADHVPEEVIVQFFDAMDEEGDDEMDLHELVQFLTHGPAIVHHRLKTRQFQEKKAKKSDQNVAIEKAHERDRSVAKEKAHERDRSVAKEKTHKRDRSDVHSAATDEQPQISTVNEIRLQPMPSAFAISQLLSRVQGLNSANAKSSDASSLDSNVVLAAASKAKRHDTNNDVVSQALKLIPLVRQLCSTRIKQLSKLASVRTFPSGSLVYTSSANADEVFIILVGQVRLQWPAADTLKIQIGMNLHHPTHGQGVISAIDESDSRAVSILFENGEEHRYKEDAIRKLLAQTEVLRAPAYFGVLAAHHSVARGHDCTAVHGEAVLLVLPAAALVDAYIRQRAKAAQVAAREMVFTMQPWVSSREPPLGLLKVLVNINKRCRYADGEIIVQSKDRCDALIFVQSGQIRLCTSESKTTQILDHHLELDPTEQAGTVDVLSAPCLIGDTHAAPSASSSILQTARYWLYTLKAIGDVEVIMVPHNALHEWETLDANKVELLPGLGLEYFGGTQGLEMVERRRALLSSSVIVVPVDLQLLDEAPGQAVLSSVLFLGLATTCTTALPEPDRLLKRVWRPCLGLRQQWELHHPELQDEEEEEEDLCEGEPLRLAYLARPEFCSMQRRCQDRDRTTGIVPATIDNQPNDDKQRVFNKQIRSGSAKDASAPQSPLFLDGPSPALRRNLHFGVPVCEHESITRSMCHGSGMPLKVGFQGANLEAPDQFEAIPNPFAAPVSVPSPNQAASAAKSLQKANPFAAPVSIPAAKAQ